MLFFILQQVINTCNFRTSTHKRRWWMTFLTNNIAIITSSQANHHTCIIQVKHLQKFCENWILNLFSHIWLMLIKLAFKPSTYRTSSRLGMSRTQMVPLPFTLATLPSPNVIFHPSNSMNEVNKYLFSVIWCEHPLSRYCECDPLALSVAWTTIHFNSFFAPKFVWHLRLLSFHSKCFLSTHHKKRSLSSSWTLSYSHSTTYSSKYDIHALGCSTSFENYQTILHNIYQKCVLFCHNECNETWFENEFF